MSERMTNTGSCIQCRRERELYRYHNDEAFRKFQLDKNKKNPERAAKIMRDWRNRQAPEKREEMREKIRESGKKFREKNPKARLFYSAKHRADKLLRTPKWAKLKEIKAIYKNCPIGMHVDHIIPLRAKHASGLHVEYNLQYLPEKENLSKRNSYEPGFFTKEELMELSKRLREDICLTK